MRGMMPHAYEESRICVVSTSGLVSTFRFGWSGCAGLVGKGVQHPQLLGIIRTAYFRYEIYNKF
jgi:hypothetical protein